MSTPSKVPTVTHDDSFIYVTVGGDTATLSPQQARDLSEALDRDATVVDSQP